MFQFLNYRNEGTNDDGIVRFSVFLPYATRQKRGKEGTNFDLENVEKWRKRLLRSASCKIRQRGKLEAGLLFDSGSCFIAGITNVRPKFRAA